ncbi:hypothetical protein ABZS79_02510 [Streptomyces griseoloalbus]|uniref:hypothetical protein n=1 Tax=Streptomyces griseoloalbus TaxID=67303 RepID=UPI0033B5F0C8
MTNPSTRVRGAGAGARRTLAAAARAAAKRTERTERTERTARPRGTEPAGNGAPADGPPPEPLSGRTLVIEPPDGWDDPPEPSPACAGDDLETADPAESADSPAERPGKAARSRRGAYGALALLLVAGLVAVAVLGPQYRDARETDRARGEALAAAREAAPVVLSYDHRHLERDFSRALARLTGDFREEYRRTTKTVVAPTAAKYRGTVKATVVAPPGGGAPAASVVSAAPDRVVVLLFVNQVTESTQVTGARLDLNRVRMTLSRTSQGWKVSAVDAL